MEDINLYNLAFAFNRRREVVDANVVDGMCANDTMLVKFTDGEMAAFGMQDGYPTVVLGTCCMRTPTNTRRATRLRRAYTTTSKARRIT